MRGFFHGPKTREEAASGEGGDILDMLGDMQANAQDSSLWQSELISFFVFKVLLLFHSIHLDAEVDQ